MICQLWPLLTFIGIFVAFSTKHYDVSWNIDLLCCCYVCRCIVPDTDATKKFVFLLGVHWTWVTESLTLLSFLSFWSLSQHWLRCFSHSTTAQLKLFFTFQAIFAQGNRIRIIYAQQIRIAKRNANCPALHVSARLDDLVFDLRLRVTTTICVIGCMPTLDTSVHVTGDVTHETHTAMTRCSLSVVRSPGSNWRAVAITSSPEVTNVLIQSLLL